jgi:hypothetical protein
MSRAAPPPAALIPPIVAIALGEEEDRSPVAMAVRQALDHLEVKGHRLRGPIAWIWVGERSRDALVFGLDAQDTAFIYEILDQIAAVEEQE